MKKKKWFKPLLILVTVVIILYLLLININNIFTMFYGYYVVRVEDDVIVFREAFADDSSGYGLMTKEGDLLYDTEYERIDFCGNHIVLEKLTEIRVVNSNHPEEEVFRFDSFDYYDENRPNENYHLTVLKDTDECMIKTSGNGPDYLILNDGRVIEVNYDRETYNNLFYGGYLRIDEPLYSEGLALFSLCIDLDEQFGYIDESGKIIIEPKYKYAKPFKDNVAVVMDKNQMGIIDREGKYIIDPFYDSLKYIKNGYVIARKGTKYGLINLNNETLIDVKYDRINLDLSEEVVYAELNNQTGIIDLHGNVIVDFEYEYIWPFRYGLARFKSNDQQGIINKEGDILVENIYDEIIITDDYLDHQLIPVKLNEKWFFIDSLGNRINDETYDHIYMNYVHKGNQTTTTIEPLIVERNDQSEFLKDGVIVATYPFMFQPDWCDERDLIVVIEDGKYGVINHEGELKTDLILTDISLSDEPIVMIGDGEGLIGEDGEILIEPKYNSIKLSDNFYVIASLKEDDTEHYGVFDLNGNKLTELEYEDIYEMDHDQFILEKNGSIYYGNTEGTLENIKSKFEFKLWP